VESQLPGTEYTGESRLPSGEYTWESITNRNNLEYSKKSKSFLDVSNGTRRNCLLKKQSKKSRATIPLKALSFAAIFPL
jgi:hypothetical protein